MKAGREMDQAIAEKVFGLKVANTVWGKKKQYSTLSVGDPKYYDDQGCMELGNPLPEYSSDITSAWEVVRAMNRSEAYEFELKLLYDGGWFCNIQNVGSNLEQGIAFADSAPEVICLAALKAVGVIK